MRKALVSMDELLRNLGVDIAALDSEGYGKITLTDAIRSIAAQKKDNITKDLVIEEIGRSYPQISVNPQSVAATLVKLSQGVEPMLFVDKRGAGNQPTIYTIEPRVTVQLSAAQMDALYDPKRTHGSGGWQSLYKRLQSRTNRDTAEVILTPKLIHEMRHYFLNYGGGGFQNALKFIFHEHTPNAFVKDVESDT